MLYWRMQTAAGIPRHTNGAERDIRRLPLETVDENLPGSPAKDSHSCPETCYNWRRE